MSVPRVKSIAEPHIKWLKRLSAGAPAAADTLSVGSERYRVLDSAPSNNVVDNLKVNSVHKINSVGGSNSEYLNRLVLENVRESDAGMYICFVTNSGFGPLTYKSAYLKVSPCTASMSHLRTLLPESSSWPLPAKWPNHAT